jgi:hypothetical protein
LKNYVPKAITGVTVHIPKGHGLAIGKPEIQPTREGAYVASLISDQPFIGCPKEHLYDLQLPQKNLLSEEWEDPITDKCFESIMTHPFGGVTFNITRTETSLPNHTVEEAKVRHIQFRRPTTSGAGQARPSMLWCSAIQKRV